MKKPIWVFDPIHGQNFYFCLGWTKGQLQRWIKSFIGIDWNPETESSAKTITFEHPEIGMYIVIWLTQFSKEKPLALNHLTHEITHASWFSLGLRGYKISHDDHESLCYMNGFLFEQVWSKLK